MGDGRFDGFDLLRIGAALVVVVSHAFWLASGVLPPVILQWVNVEMNAGSIAVAVFFVTSGYLVSASWASDSNLARFAARRGARIWPGLMTVLLVSTFVVGPLVTTWSLGDYLTSPLTWYYPLSGSILDISYVLPGVFEDHATPSVNGSLWTLPLEVACYLGLAAAGSAGLLRSRWRVGSITVLVVAWAWLVSVGTVTPPMNVAGWGFFDLPVFAALFALGVAGRTFDVPRSPWVALTAFVVLVVVRDRVIEPIALLAIAYLTVWAGTSSTPIGARVHRYGDPSYGIYVWGWVVSQVLVGLGVRTPWALALLSMIIATVVGYGSWWLIERRALTALRRRLKVHHSAQAVARP